MVYLVLIRTIMQGQHQCCQKMKSREVSVAKAEPVPYEI